MIEAYPLQWPTAWPRTERPKRSAFTTSLAAARDEVSTELRLLGAREVVISTNIITNLDGTYRSKQHVPDDRGVAVYFKLDGEDQCFPCDRWLDVAENLHAIALSIGALRGLDRWGAKEMVAAAFRGFKALPASAIVTPFTAKPWHEVLGVAPDASREMVDAAYRVQAKKLHPDLGGSQVEFEGLTRAYEQAKAVR